MAAETAVQGRIDEMKAENAGLVDKAINAVKGVINTIRQLKDMLLSVLAKAVSVITTIIKDPIGFLGNLVDGVRAGLSGFQARIGTHLQNALFEWLLGPVREMGIEMPEALDFKGILKLVLQVMGLTWQNIRAKLVKALGEPVVARMEGAVDVVRTLASEGIGGLWTFLKDKLGDIQEQVLGQIKSFVIEKVVVAGITWMFSLLNPASAFIKAAKAIYDIVMFIVNKGSQIKEFVDAVLDSISDIAKGGIGGVAAKIEGVLAKALPLAIGFLASLLGLGGIGEKVKKIIETIRRPVDIAINSLIKGVVKTGKKLFGGATSWAKGKYAAGKAYVKGKVEAGKAYVTGKARAAKHQVMAKLGSSWDAIRGHLRRGFSADGKEHQVSVTSAGRVVIASGDGHTSDEHAAGAKAAAKANNHEDKYDDIDAFSALIKQHEQHFAKVRADEAQGLDPADPKNARFFAAIDEVVGRARALWSYVKYSGNPSAPTAPADGVPKNLGNIAPHGRQPNRGADLLSEHVLPQAWLSDQLEAAGVRRLDTRQYEQMTTILIYKSAADIKTNETGGDNTGLRNILNDIGNPTSVTIERVDNLMDAINTDHAKQKRPGAALPTRSAVSQAAAIQFSELVRYVRENADTATGGGVDFKGSSALVARVEQLIQGAGTNPKFASEATAALSRLTRWLRDHSTTAPPPTRALVARTREKLEAAKSGAAK